jgi:hypothetical protein
MVNGAKEGLLINLNDAFNSGANKKVIPTSNH